MIKKILYIFIPVLAVLLMSHNTFAVDLSHSVVYQGSGASPQWHDDSNSSASNSWHTGSSTYSGNSGNAKDFNSFYIRSSNGNNLPIQSSWFLQVSGQIIFSGTDNKWNTSGNFSYTTYGNCSIVDFDFVDVQSHTGSTSNTNQIYNFNLICKYTGSNNGVPQVNLRVHGTSQLDTYRFSINNWFLWSASPGFNDSAIISAINNVRSSINNIYNSLGNTNKKLDDIKDALNTLHETQQKEENQANENISQNSQDSATSSSDSQTATSSLMSVIASGIGAITSASPTNCKINGNMGNLNIGNIDLCANPVPSFMAIIGSIIAVLVVLPLVILLFNRFISIIRSFQR